MMREKFQTLQMSPLAVSCSDRLRMNFFKDFPAFTTNVCC
jgi:hypothetical protein